MNRSEAWKVVAEHVELGYEGDELEECREYIQKFDAAYKIVRTSLNRRWWEVWK